MTNVNKSIKYNSKPYDNSYDFCALKTWKTQIKSEGEKMVMLGTLSECFYHWVEKNKDDQASTKELIAFIGASTKAVRSWVRGDGLPSGNYLYKLMYFLEAKGYLLLDLLLLDEDVYTIGKMLAYGVLENETVWEYFDLKSDKILLDYIFLRRAPNEEVRGLAKIVNEEKSFELKEVLLSKGCSKSRLTLDSVTEVSTVSGIIETTKIKDLTEIFESIADHFGSTENIPEIFLRQFSLITNATADSVAYWFKGTSSPSGLNAIRVKLVFKLLGYYIPKYEILQSEVQSLMKIVGYGILDEKQLAEELGFPRYEALYELIGLKTRLSGDRFKKTVFVTKKYTDEIAEAQGRFLQAVLRLKQIMKDPNTDSYVLERFFEEGFNCSKLKEAIRKKYLIAIYDGSFEEALKQYLLEVNRRSETLLAEKSAVKNFTGVNNQQILYWFNQRNLPVGINFYKWEVFLASRGYYSFSLWHCRDTTFFMKMLFAFNLYTKEKLSEILGYSSAETLMHFTRYDENLSDEKQKKLLELYHEHYQEIVEFYYKLVSETKSLDLEKPISQTVVVQEEVEEDDGIPDESYQQEKGKTKESSSQDVEVVELDEEEHDTDVEVVELDEEEYYHYKAQEGKEILIRSIVKLLGGVEPLIEMLLSDDFTEDERREFRDLFDKKVGHPFFHLPIMFNALCSQEARKKYLKELDKEK